MNTTRCTWRGQYSLFALQKRPKDSLSSWFFFSDFHSHPRRNAGLDFQPQNSPSSLPFLQFIALALFMASFLAAFRCVDCESCCDVCTFRIWCSVERTFQNKLNCCVWMNEAFSNTDNIPDKQFNVNKWKSVAEKEVTCQLHCHLFTEETFF